MSILTSSLNFTKSVGRRDTPDDVPFSDITEVGKFPSEQQIKSISRISVYADSRNKYDAVIVGLSVTYNLVDGKTYTIDRGLVNETQIADFGVGDDELLVGVYGRLKNNPGSNSNGRVATISFVLFDKQNASMKTEGPFHATPVKFGTPWGCFGKIVAFQGTKTDNYGITSLGFVKSDNEEDPSSPFGFPGQP